MVELFSQYEATIRLSSFLGIFLIIGIWERVAPRRVLSVSRALRWANNLSLVVINTLVIRLLFPTAAVGVSLMAANHGWGLFNSLDLPQSVVVPVSILILDLCIYGQHVLMHFVPLLWRLHRVHHADLDFDVTTGIRFHPIEIVVSMLIKFCVIVALGAPVVAVVLFEVILNATSLFNHGNIRIPIGIDRVLRWLLVTPDMHRVHHSIEPDETNSNFGFNLSCWDRLFQTYRDQPRAGHSGLTIGIPTFRTLRMCTWLNGMLLIPFQRDGDQTGNVAS